MRCPFCNHEDTQVRDSRPSEDGFTIRRRRVCMNCERRFTTFEKFQVQQLLVVKRDGRRELFDRDKLVRSLLIALRKRPVDQTQVMQVVADIEADLTLNGRTEVAAKDIGDAVLNALKKLDFTGYIRYASVYNDFEGPPDFQALLNSIK